jgi:hypothetical protein
VAYDSLDPCPGGGEFDSSICECIDGAVQVCTIYSFTYQGELISKTGCNTTPVSTTYYIAIPAGWHAPQLALSDPSYTQNHEIVCPGVPESPLVSAEYTLRAKDQNNAFQQIPYITNNFSYIKYYDPGLYVGGSSPRYLRYDSYTIQEVCESNSCRPGAFWANNLGSSSMECI